MRQGQTTVSNPLHDRVRTQINSSVPQMNLSVSEFSGTFFLFFYEEH